MSLLTRGDLETLLRETGLEAYGLHPACHPRAGVDALYAGQATVHLTCHRCHGAVATLAMAEALPPNRWVRREDERP